MPSTKASYKAFTVLALLGLLFSPFPHLPLVDGHAQVAAAQVAGANASTSAGAPDEPADGGAFTDTTQADFEAATRTRLDAASAPGSVLLALRPAPVASAGGDRSVAEGASVNLDGSASQGPLGGPLTYRWRQVGGPGVTLYTTDPARPTFVPPNVTRDTVFGFELIVDDGVAQSGPDQVQITVVADNDAPVADAGPDQAAHEGTQVTLDGRRSRDVNGDTLTFTWTQTKGAAASISDPHARRPVIGLPDIRRAETVVFELSISDGTTASAPDSVAIQVTADNEAPTADAGPDQAVGGGSLVHLDAGGSADPNGDALSYLWTQTAGTAVALLGADTVSPIFVAPYLTTNDTLGFQVRISDGRLSAVDAAAVTVLAGGGPGVAFNWTVTGGSPTYSGSATISWADGDKDLGRFSSTAGASAAGYGLLTVYTCSSSNPDVKLIFGDTLLDQTSDINAHLIASLQNAAPAPTVTGFSPASGNVGTEVTISGSQFETTNPANNKVFFNNIEAIVLSATATQLVARVPAEATSGLVTVSTPFGTAASAASFSVTGQGVTSEASRLSTAADALSSLAADPLSGAASTSIPIAVPPGRQGVAPSLALIYNSAAGNSWLGVGWDLHHSFIERSTRHGKPSYDDNTDTFIVNVPGARLNLDNVELVPIGAGEYRAKNESGFARFRLSGGNWQMWDTGGTLYTFGAGSGRMANGQGAYRWYLEQVEDTHGNFMTLDYTTDQGQVYLQRIVYTGHAGNSETGRQQIDFRLEARPDALASYVSGAAVIMAKRLAAIEVRSDGALVRRYDLGYTLSAGTGRSLLSSVTEAGSDGTSTLPKVLFRYQAGRSGWALASSWALPANMAFTTGSNDDQDNGVRLAYVNGDALVDLVQAAGTDMGKHRTWLNTGSGFALSTDWVVPQTMAFTTDQNKSNGVQLADVDGDALLDLVKGKGSERAVYLNSGSGWTVSATWIVPGGAEFLTADDKDNGVRLADVNGDGLADLVQSVATDAAKHRVWLNSGTGWALSGWVVPADAGFVTSDDKSTGVAMADVNGDGLDDLVQSRGSAAATHRVWLNNNAGWAASTASVPLGTEFAEPFDERFDNGVRFADANGDGRVDFIQADGGLAGQHRVWLNNGLAWDNPVYTVPLEAAFTEPANGHADNGVRLADINGDGLLDLLQADGTDAAQRRVWLNSSPAPDLLVEVRSGIGAVAEVAYQPSSAYDNTGADERPDLPFVVQTAVRVTLHDGLGHSYAVNTTYAGGYFDAPERDFRGFGYARVTDPAGHYAESWFAQDDVYRGKLARSETHAAGGVLLQEASNTWAVTEPGAGRSFVYLSQEQATTHDGGVSVTTRVRYEYDAYGNTTAVQNDGDVSLSGDEVYAATEYAANLEAWLLALPKHTEIRNASGTLYAQTWSFYDGLAYGEVLKGDLTRQQSWHSSDPDPEVTFTYDAYGNVVSATDALGHTTTTAYDSTFHAFPISVANALGHTASKVYNPGTGQVLQATDANGQTSRSEYDVFGSLVKAIQPGDSAAYPTVSYGYDLTSLPVRSTVRTLERSGYSGVWLAHAYSDGLGRQLQKQVEGRDGQWTVAESVIYDGRGQVQHQLAPYFAASSAYDPPDLGRPHSTFSYDALGRLVKAVNPDGTEVNKSYNGRTSRVVDELGNAKTYTNDGLGRLVQVQEENGAETYTTRYTYDPLNHLLSTRDHLGNVTTMGYDSLGRKTSMDDPDMGDWTYGYDANGNLVSQSDARRQTVRFEYDALNRIVRKDYPAGTDVVYTYDDPAVSNSVGRLTQVSDASGVTRFAYNALGRTVREEKLVDGASYVVRKGYDALGRMTHLVYPDGSQVDYVYDEGGNLERVSEGSTNYVLYPAYNAQGQVEQAGYGNGVVTDYTYDPLTFLLSRLVTQRGATRLQDLAYSFDDAGNIAGIADAVSDNDQAFTYDDLYRLTGATGEGWSRSYSYDAIGNMLSNSAVGAYVYGQNGAGPHAVTTAGTKTYTYDANGNMTAGAGRTLSYDYDNRLTGVQTAADTATFLYDGDGGRVKKTVVEGATTTSTLYIGELYEVTGGVATRHIFAGSNRIADVTGGHVYYIHSDHLGSSSSVTDAAGAQVQRLAYYPFGEVRVNQRTGDVDISHKFTGKELDAETGLYFYGARYYDPVLARFITADIFVQSLGDAQAFNRYAYARNNPLKYTDPTGYGFWKAIKNFFKSFWKPIVATAVAVLTAGLAAPAVAAVFGTGTLLASAATGAIVGATYQATNTALNGGSLSQVAGAALRGAAVGAFRSVAMFGLNQAIPSWSQTGGGNLSLGERLGLQTTRILGQGTIEGAAGAMHGGKFETAFLLGAGAATLRWGIESFTGAEATFEKGGDAVSKRLPNGEWVAVRDPMANNIGVRIGGSSQLLRNLGLTTFVEEGGIMSRTMNQFAGFNSGAVLHDNFAEMFHVTFLGPLNGPVNLVTNPGSIAPVIATNYLGLGVGNWIYEGSQEQERIQRSSR